MTPHRRLVLLLLLQEPEPGWWYGYEIIKRLGMLPGTVYPILRCFASAGWLVERWEHPLVANMMGRPRRRLYRLTIDGVLRARAEIASGLTPFLTDLATALDLDVGVVTAPSDPR